MWKVPDGWNRSGKWDQNKRASNVSVCVPPWEGQSKTMGCTLMLASLCCVCGCVWAQIMRMWKKNLFAFVWCFYISRWLLVCTWPSSYQIVPLLPVSFQLAPLYSQCYRVLEMIICNIFFYSLLWHPRSLPIISVQHIQRITCQTVWEVFFLKFFFFINSLLFSLRGGFCSLKCPFHTRALTILFYPSLFWWEM